MITTNIAFNEKINWLLKYCAEYPGHEFMYDERLDNSEKFNIDLGIEEYILDNIDDINFILLTGDAGDGKTRVLNNLKETLDSHEWIIINDFSEHAKAYQMEIIEKAYNAIVGKNIKIIVAGNSGIFMNSVMESKFDILDKLKNEKNCLFTRNEQIRSH